MQDILNEVRVFCNFVLNYNESYEKELLMYRYCPFKTMKYSSLLDICKYVGIYNVADLIMGFATYLGYTYDEIEKIRLYMHTIGFDYYVDSFLNGNLHVMKENKSIKEIVDDYANINNNNYANVVGNYSELSVYNYEKKKHKSDGNMDFVKRIIWASREIGDIFGYDILSFERDGNERLIEVKGTLKGNKSLKLTENENRLFENPHADILPSKFYVYHVDLLNNEIYEIRKDGKYILDQYGNEYDKNNYILTRKK